ncbi:hypothetical protein B7P43_G06896 [Cryptotermes secundus]|uniref:Uncharacterized protein n=1 Tax=Cryptotermes secundus TaxID=105785 RepID=A0A2J7PNA6_9NEOP|nr:hypothetical protein B7P43_G06896 [Cryptotermes secundus]
MVQGGERGASTSVLEHGSRNSSSRKAIFDAQQKKVQEEKKTQEDRKIQESKKTQYGAWGPVLKNKQNFVNMHIF